jgi:hypothetical protein
MMIIRCRTKHWQSKPRRWLRRHRQVKTGGLLAHSTIRLVAHAVVIVILMAVATFLWEVGHFAQPNDAMEPTVPRPSINPNADRPQFRFDPARSDSRDSMGLMVLSGNDNMAQLNLAGQPLTQTAFLTFEVQPPARWGEWRLIAILLVVALGLQWLFVKDKS